MRAIITLVVTFAFSAAAFAQGTQYLNQGLADKVQFRAGPFFTQIDSSVEVEGVDADLDDRLEDSDTVLAVGGFVRLGKRIRLNVAYWGSSRENSEVLSQPVPIGPINIPAGTKFDILYENSTLMGGLGWAFVRNETTEFGVDVGISIVNLKSRLTVTPNNLPTVDLVNLDETEPMPTIGLFLEHALSPTWLVAGRAGYLGFDISDIEGDIYDIQGRIEYRPFKNFGIGAAYIYSKADAILKSDSGDRAFKYTYKGPFAYLVFGFGSAR